MNGVRSISMRKGYLLTALAAAVLLAASSGTAYAQSIGFRRGQRHDDERERNPRQWILPGPITHPEIVKVRISRSHSGRRPQRRNRRRLVLRTMPIWSCTTQTTEYCWSRYSHGNTCSEILANRPATSLRLRSKVGIDSGNPSTDADREC